MAKEKKEKLEHKKEEVKVVKKDYTSELFYIFIAMVVIIAVIFLIPYIRNAGNNFTYNNMKFYKEKINNIDFFHYSYYLTSGDQQYLYNLYLRNDPRKNDVPVNGSLLYSNTNLVYLGLDSSNLLKCSDSSIAVAALASFISDNQLTLETGVSDSAVASANNLTHITCEAHPYDTVILIKGINGTTNIQADGTCKTINVANCEILKAVEKFETQSIIDAKRKSAY